MEPNEKIFVFNYMSDEWLSADIVHKTWYYLYDSIFSNNLSDVKYIWFAHSNGLWTKSWFLKEYWENMEPQNTKSNNAITLKKLEETENINSELISAFRSYYDVFHSEEMSFDRFRETEERNYIKVGNFQEFAFENVPTHSKIPTSSLRYE